MLAVTLNEIWRKVPLAPNVLDVTDGLRFVKPFTCTPFTDPSGFVCLKDTRFNVDAIGETLEEALIELEEEFFFVWDNFAQEANERLSENAIKLKYFLLENITPITQEEEDTDD